MWRYIDIRNFISLSRYGKLYHDDRYIDNIAHHYHQLQCDVIIKTNSSLEGLS